MSTGRLLLLAMALTLTGLPLAEAANEKSALPAIDLQARCKRAEAAAIDMMGDQSMRGTAFDTCLKAETAARDALQAAWADVPSAYKGFCVRPRDFSASYVEWIACLEMMIDVKKLRTQNGPSLGEAPKQCPMITYADDGSIMRVVACPHGGQPR